MTDAEWIACRIGLLMNQQGRTLRDVASYLGVSPSSVLNWVNGRAVPSAVSLVRLARLMNVSLDVFDRDNHGE